MEKSNNTKDMQRSFQFGLLLNGLYAILEFSFGLLAGSLALVADAVHNLTDTITLFIAFMANIIAGRSPNTRKTFGYGRVTILASLLNAIIMLVSAGLIIFEAIKRLENPIEIQGEVVAIVALVGIIINGTIAFKLSKHKNDLNIKTAFIDMFFDAISSFGAMIAGLIINFTGAKYIDSIVGLIVAVFLIFNTLKLLKEAVAILLEGTPPDVDTKAITKAISTQPKVLKVDDVHIWSIRSNYNALSCHIIVKESKLSDTRIIIDKIKKLLKEKYNISHATIEVELENCKSKHNL